MGPCRPPIVRIAIGASTGTGQPGLSQNRAARLASLKQRCFLHALNARHRCAGGLENVVSSGAAPISQTVEEQEKFDFAEKSPSGATVSGTIARRGVFTGGRGDEGCRYENDDRPPSLE